MTVVSEPYRVVDNADGAWLVTTDADGPHRLYTRSADRERLTLDRIADTHGGWRPVVAPTDDEIATLVSAMRLAGRKAIVSIAAALEVVFDAARQRNGGLDASGDSYGAAERALIAGRPGSWESVVLMEVVLIGNGFNLTRPTRSDPPGQADRVAAQRARGPVSRVHRVARDQLARVFTAWTSSPHRYVEVAETLASIIGEFADAEYGSAGWSRIADQWLQPDARMPSADFLPLYRLLYSQSEHFNTDLL